MRKYKIEILILIIFLLGCMSLIIWPEPDVIPDIEKWDRIEQACADDPYPEGCESFMRHRAEGFYD